MGFWTVVCKSRNILYATFSIVVQRINVFIGSLEAGDLPKSFVALVTVIALPLCGKVLLRQRIKLADTIKTTFVGRNFAQYRMSAIGRSTNAAHVENDGLLKLTEAAFKNHVLNVSPTPPIFCKPDFFCFLLTPTNPNRTRAGAPQDWICSPYCRGVLHIRIVRLHQKGKGRGESGACQWCDFRERNLLS